MSWHKRIRNVFRTEKISAELDDELSYHIAETVDELVAGGMSERDAHKEANRRFGNYASQKERTRDMLIARWLEAFVGDLRYGARQLRLNPGFAAVAILSLALGIGANSAIFQLINAVRLRPLPVPHPEELVAVVLGPDFAGAGSYSARNAAFTYAQYEQMLAHQEAFSAMLAFGTTRFNLSPGGEVRNADGLYVTPNFLNVLGVIPALGAWNPPDDPTDCTQTGALLDFAFWQREFGGDPSVIGRDISLNGRSFPVQAVTPASFYGLEQAYRFDVALPVCADGVFAQDGKGRLANITAWWLTPIGRLKPGWTVERASAHLRVVSPVIFSESLPESYQPDLRERYLANKLLAADAHAGVSPIRRQYDRALSILLGITGLVLLIACANLANLLLAKASARVREVALRQAVGASRGRLVGQLMSESLLLAGCGCVLGGLLSYLLSRGLVLFLSSGGHQLYVPLRLDWRVLGFTVAIAAATCLLFGLAPALRAARTGPAEAMRGSRGTASTSERRGLRRVLVLSQIALSFVLLVGALLFGQSLRNLMTSDIGMDSEGVLVAAVDASRAIQTPERRAVVFHELEERLNRLPDVVSAGAVERSPFGDSEWARGVQADDGSAASGGETAWLNRVSPNYFPTMRTPILAGRNFDSRDSNDGTTVAIVNEKFVEVVYGGGDPIGRTFRYEGNVGEQVPVFQVVGLVANTRYRNLREETRPIAFLPVAQADVPRNGLTYVLRARGAFSSVMVGVQREMAEVDRGLQVEFLVMDAQIAQSVMRDRLMANLSGGFGLLAAILSMLGLYGVMSYMVARRRNEIGVRTALGAETGRILRLVFGEVGWLLLIGLVIGLAGSFALSRYAASLLYELQPNDPLTMVLASVLLALTAVAAALFPARRAARLDPAVVLRDE